MSDAKPVRVIDPVPFIGGAPLPKPEDVIFVTYPDTFDGWLAAWVVRKAAREFQLHIEMQTDGGMTEDISGRLWIAVGGYGFALANAPKQRQVLFIGSGNDTEALPFQQWERALPYGVKSMGAHPEVGFRDGSFAASAWRFFYAHRVGFEPLPRLIALTNDYVGGHEQMQFSRQIVECAKSYEPSFQTIDSLVKAADDKKRRENMIIAGQAICRYIDRHKSA